MVCSLNPWEFCGNFLPTIRLLDPQGKDQFILI